MEVAPGIHMVLTEEIGANVANSYLVVGREGAAWIDTGWDRLGEGQARVDYWKSIGSPVLKGYLLHAPAPALLGQRHHDPE